jgi:Na+-driven multidrug efflux pump
MDGCLVYARRVDAFFETRPVLKCIWITAIFFPLVAAVAMIEPLIAARVSVKGGVMVLVSYKAIRATVKWLEELHNYLWFVQMSAIPYYEGSADLSVAGGFVSLGTAVALLMGLLSMLVCMAFARPLLRWLSPPEADVDLIQRMALTAQYVMALHIPAFILVSNFAGISLGMRVIVKTFGLMVLLLAVALYLLLSMTEGLSCEEQLIEAAAAAKASGGKLDSRAWVCPEGPDFLVNTALVDVVFAWVIALAFIAICLVIGHRRGYFAAKGFAPWKYKDDLPFLKQWATKTAGTSVRTVVSQTRVPVALGLALRMSPTSAAVYIMITELGNLTSNVSTFLASGSMMVGSKCYGEGRYADLMRVLRFYTGFAIFSGLLFTAVVASSRNLVPTLFVNEVELEEFQRLAETVYPIGIFQQPFRAFTAVYGPLLMTTQNHAVWGVVVSAIFLFVWLPLAIISAVMSDVRWLLATNVVYDVALTCALMGFMHFKEIPRIQELARMPVADTDEAGKHVTSKMSDEPADNMSTDEPRSQVATSEM